MVSEYEPEKKFGVPEIADKQLDIVMLLKLLACYCRDWIVHLFITGLPDQPRPVCVQSAVPENPTVEVRIKHEGDRVTRC